MTIDPPLSPTAEPFWDGTRERQLVLQRCSACDRSIHHPRARCPGCGDDALEWRAHDGRGRIHSWAVHPPGKGDDGDGVVVAMVDLDDGPRMLAQLLGSAAGIDVDHPVCLCWLPLEDGRALPCFELDEGGAR